MSVPLVTVVRSGLVESVHRGSVAVADADGRLVAWAGDPHQARYVRSAMKPLQAAVSLSRIGDPPPEAEIAVMCASHNGEEVHLEAVRSLLGRGGLGVEHLRTPPARPLLAEAAARAPEPRPELHNCSGKHAGMLLACARRGDDVATYPRPDHPLQRAVLEAVEEGAGPPQRVGVDGCGVPVHAVSLGAMATLYARLARPQRLGGLEDHARRAVAAMRSHPYLVAGKDRVCTAVMDSVPEIAVKAGAEGLVCAALLDRGLGMAVKIEDGSARAADPAAIHALALLGVLGSAEERLAPFRRPPVLGGGAPVGSLVPEFTLSRA